MLDNVKKENILFLDIETVPGYRDYNEVPDNIKPLWDHKASFLKKDELETSDSLYDRAGIYAEFGKIICISVGYLHDGNLRLKSFASHDEWKLLTEFAELLNKSYNKSNSLLCAHNGKEFDYPYISRRMIINGIKLPAILNIAGKKPWDIKLLDTMELWKFGDYKSYTSLALLTTILGIDTPKDDIKGSDVYKTYWEENDLERVVTYCQKDVIAIVQIFLRYKGEETISPENIFII